MELETIVKCVDCEAIFTESDIIIDDDYYKEHCPNCKSQHLLDLCDGFIYNRKKSK